MDKILVIKLGALGDFIQALGPMAAIRKHHKDAHITLLTTEPFEGFSKECGYFDKIWIDKKPGKLNIIGWLALHKKLNSEEFKRVYDLQNNDRTGLYFKLLSNPKPKWSGAVKGASHRNTSPKRTAGHAFDGHIQTLGISGITGIKPDRLDWIKSDVSNLKPDGAYMLLIPGCAPGREEKRWPAEHFAAIAKLTSRAGITPVILGTKAEEKEAQIIEQSCEGQCINLIDQTSLAQIVTLARNAKTAIGNDTGPMHLIAATGCPSLVLFSSHSNSIRHAPKGNHVEIIQRDHLPDLKAEEVWEKIHNIDKIATAI